MSTSISFTKILVPVDGSQHSERAAKYAIDIAMMRKAKLIAIHVMHLPAYVFTPAPIEGMPAAPIATPIPGAISNEEKKVAESYLKHVKDLAEKAGVAIETRIIENEPSVVSAITEFAQKEGCDLIVIGTKGRTGIRKVLMGSVADGVVTYAPCPVLVVR